MPGHHVVAVNFTHDLPIVQAQLREAKAAGVDVIVLHEQLYTAGDVPTKQNDGSYHYDYKDPAAVQAFKTACIAAKMTYAIYIAPPRWQSLMGRWAAAELYYYLRYLRGAEPRAGLFIDGLTLGAYATESVFYRRLGRMGFPAIIAHDSVGAQGGGDYHHSIGADVCPSHIMIGEQKLWEYEKCNEPWVKRQIMWLTAVSAHFLLNPRCYTGPMLDPKLEKSWNDFEAPKDWPHGKWLHQWDLKKILGA